MDRLRPRITARSSHFHCPSTSLFLVCPLLRLSIFFPVFIQSHSFFCKFRISNTSTAMARTKQATPLRREPSSEYFSKADAPGTPSRSPRNLEKTNGYANGHTNGHVETIIDKLPVPVADKEHTILQLLFAVGGIYGSL